MAHHGVYEKNTSKDRKSRLAEDRKYNILGIVSATKTEESLPLQ